MIPPLSWTNGPWLRNATSAGHPPAGRLILAGTSVRAARYSSEFMSDDQPEQGVPPPPDLAALSVAAYEDLLKLARARLRSSGPFTLLDTAGLVSDTYKRLAQQHHLQIK